MSLIFVQNGSPIVPTLMDSSCNIYVPNRDDSSCAIVVVNCLIDEEISYELVEKLCSVVGFDRTILIDDSSKVPVEEHQPLRLLATDTAKVTCCNNI